jgi:hypothetical protein
MIQARTVPAAAGARWLVSGWRMLRARPALWLSLAFVYLAFAMLLEQIPFIGWLILLLTTPVLLLGALPVAHSQADDNLPDADTALPPAARGLRNKETWRAWALYLRDLLRRSAAHLFAGFQSERRLLPVMVVSTLLLGGVIVLRILAALLKAGSSLHAMMLGSVTPNVWLPDLVATLLILTLLVMLVMTVLYTVPLILFRGAHPLPAFESSFYAARRNLGAFLTFAGCFLLLAVLSRSLFFFLLFPLDYLVFLLIGLVALPVLVGGLYASYSELFAKRNNA